MRSFAKLDIKNFTKRYDETNTKHKKTHSPGY